MFVRNLKDVEKAGRKVNWGAGTSHRLLVDDDKMGFGICHTVVSAGQEARLQYRNHLEACYCIGGAGEVEDMQGNISQIRPGDVYVLDQHDEHFLRAHPDRDMILVSVFNPPLKGDEVHKLDAEGASSY